MAEIWPFTNKWEDNFTDFTMESLNTSDPGYQQHKGTNKKLLHGIFLLEDSIPLHRYKRACLYLYIKAVCLDTLSKLARDQLLVPLKREPLGQSW